MDTQTRSWPFLCLVAFLLCWAGPARSEEDAPKKSSKAKDAKPQIIQIDVDKLPPDLAKRLLIWSLSQGKQDAEKTAKSGDDQKQQRGQHEDDEKDKKKGKQEAKKGEKEDDEKDMKKKGKGKEKEDDEKEEGKKGGKGKKEDDEKGFRGEQKGEHEDKGGKSKENDKDTGKKKGK